MTDTTEEVGTNALAGDAPVIEAPEAVIEEQHPEPENQPETEPKPHHLKGKTPWYMERINEETNKRRAIEEQLTQKNREAEEARALLERLQNGDKPPTNVRTETPQDEEAKIEARAALKLLQRDSSTVRNAGIRAYPDFSDSLKMLTSVGATSDEFVQDLIDTDMTNAHKMIDFLAKDPDRALELVNMSSKRRVAELTRISMSELNKPAPVVAPKAAISKVPAPKPVIDAVSDDSGETDLTNDKLDDRTWSRLWDKKYNKRA